MDRYKIYYSGFAFVEADSKEEAEELYHEGNTIFEEEQVDEVEKVDEIIITWDDAPITYDDVSDDVKELVEYGIYTEEEVLEELNRSRKRHKKHISISEDNT